MHRRPHQIARPKSEQRGFYAPETLSIAADAADQSATLYDVFLNSMVPEGDNDSTAALALGLWGWRSGNSPKLQSLIERLDQGDRRTLEQTLS
jgi:hypothetical protein